MSAPALEVRDLRKSYGALQALRGVDLTVQAGEVHALLGQNGCGKSTLVKSLTGVVTPDGGTAHLHGRAVTFPVTALNELGVAVIHQDIGLHDGMTVLENLGAPVSYGTRLLGLVNDRRERSVYRDLMASIGVDIPLDRRVGLLSPGDRAMLGVVRAMRELADRDGDALFILDEPTAALGRAESDRVLELMRRVAANGSAVVFISHRLNEVMAACDRVTVIRDGRDVFTGSAEQLDRAQIVGHMLGRRLDELFPSPPQVVSADVRLRATALAGPGLPGIDLAVRSGEIVGVTGLAGMGQPELARVVSGVAPRSSGALTVDDRPVAGGSPAAAIAAGIAFVPGNRLREGVWLDATAGENVTLPLLRRFRRGPALNGRAERRHVRERLETVRLNPLAPDRPVSGFSGGNQQKIVFAKWLQLTPKVLVLEEPTQGVDPGASRDLFDQVVAAAERGAAVVILSGDHEQLVELCHRVVILGHGRVAEEIPRERLSEEVLVDACARAA